jgi:hypothetical protein
MIFSFYIYLCEIFHTQNEVYRCIAIRLLFRQQNTCAKFPRTVI